jgi:hypothetical protein
MVLVRKSMEALDKRSERLNKRGTIRSKAHAKQIALQREKLLLMISRRKIGEVEHKTLESKKISRLCRTTNKNIDSSIDVMKRLERLISSSLKTFNRGEELVPPRQQKFYRRREPKKPSKRSQIPPTGDTLDAWSWVSNSGEKREAWGVSQATTSDHGVSGETLMAGMHAGGVGSIGGGAGVPSRLPGQSVGLNPRPPTSPRNESRSRVNHHRAWVGGGGHAKPKMGCG